MQTIQGNHVLVLIVDFLKQQKLFASVLQVLQESQLDPWWLGGPNEQVWQLREWIFQGRWHRAIQVFEGMTRLPPQQDEKQVKTTVASILQILRRFKQLEEAYPTLAQWHCVEEIRLSGYEALLPLLRDVNPQDLEIFPFLKGLDSHAETQCLLEHILGEFCNGEAIRASPCASITRHKQNSGISGGDPCRCAQCVKSFLFGELTITSTSSNAFVLKVHNPKNSIDAEQNVHSNRWMSQSCCLPRRTPLILASPSEGVVCGPQQPVPVQRDDKATQTQLQVQSQSTQTVVKRLCDQDIQVSTMVESASTQTPPPLPTSPAPARITIMSSPKVESEAPFDLQEQEKDDHQENPEDDEIDELVTEGTVGGEPKEQDGTTQSVIASGSLAYDHIGRLQVVAEAREAHAVRAMEISPNGQFVAIGTNARALRVFDAIVPFASNTVSGTLRNANSSTTPMVMSKRAGASHLLDVVMERHKHHTSSLYTVTWHLSNQILASGSADSSIKVIPNKVAYSQFRHDRDNDEVDEIVDISSVRESPSKELWIRTHPGKSRVLQFAPDASTTVLLSASSGDRLLRFYDLTSCFSSLSTATTNQLRHKESVDQSFLRLDGHAKEITCARFLAGNDSNRKSTYHSTRVVSGSLDKTIRLWDLRSGCCEKLLTRSDSAPFDLAVHPSSDLLLASAHENGVVNLWDTRVNKVFASVSHHQDQCRAVSWSPDGKWLASGGFDGCLCIMQLADQLLEPVASFHQHKDKVLQVQWHPNQPCVVTTGADRTVKLWGFY